MLKIVAMNKLTDSMNEYKIENETDEIWRDGFTLFEKMHDFIFFRARECA